jgi:hypothetical protein
MKLICRVHSTFVCRQQGTTAVSPAPLTSCVTLIHSRRSYHFGETKAKFGGDLKEIQ